MGDVKYTPEPVRFKQNVSAGYKCPKCGYITIVTDSRPREDGAVRRRRKCKNPRCRHRFTTCESEEVLVTAHREHIIDRIMKLNDEITSLLAKWSEPLP
jgi:predicted RNA-binding Zn-ribbon protein involved in translation (DUF1610 family)